MANYAPEAASAVNGALFNVSNSYTLRVGGWSDPYGGPYPAMSGFRLPAFNPGSVTSIKLTLAVYILPYGYPLSYIAYIPPTVTTVPALTSVGALTGYSVGSSVSCSMGASVSNQSFETSELKPLWDEFKARPGWTSSSDFAVFLNRATDDGYFDVHTGNVGAGFSIYAPYFTVTTDAVTTKYRAGLTGGLNRGLNQGL